MASIVLTYSLISLPANTQGTLYCEKEARGEYVSVEEGGTEKSVRLAGTFLEGRKNVSPGLGTKSMFIENIVYFFLSINFRVKI